MNVSGTKMEPLINHFIKLSLDEQDYYDTPIVEYFNALDSPLRKRIIECRAGSNNQRKIKYFLLLNPEETKNTAIYPAIYIYPEYLMAFSSYGIGDMIKNEYKSFPYFNDIPTIKSYFDQQDVNISPKIKSKATRYDYLHNKYKNAYSLSKYTALNPATALANDMYELSVEIDTWFENINFKDYFKQSGMEKSLI